MKTPPPGRQWQGGGEVGIKNVDKYFDTGHTNVAHTPKLTQTTFCDFRSLSKWSNY